ncbi:hypothetical protein LSTR_LSTR003997 [Laodelphax striatellus]|uniref:Uncharacterized protein n=1 Tax=Laodelphax striatellus TaxID=195883 RepID=A0A482WF60_LAOST|nr:hypothetical protein LSTR_LSTR003997 [Laodelphax striatellus]
MLQTHSKCQFTCNLERVFVELFEVYRASGDPEREVSVSSGWRVIIVIVIKIRGSVDRRVVDDSDAIHLEWTKAARGQQPRGASPAVCQQLRPRSENKSLSKLSLASRFQVTRYALKFPVNSSP